jgi:hypothetical protein
MAGVCWAEVRNSGACFVECCLQLLGVWLVFLFCHRGKRGKREKLKELKAAVLVFVEYCLQLLLVWNYHEEQEEKNEEHEEKKGRSEKLKSE